MGGGGRAYASCQQMVEKGGGKDGYRLTIIRYVSVSVSVSVSVVSV